MVHFGLGPKFQNQCRLGLDSDSLKSTEFEPGMSFTFSFDMFIGTLKICCLFFDRWSSMQVLLKQIMRTEIRDTREITGTVLTEIAIMKNSKKKRILLRMGKFGS